MESPVANVNDPVVPVELPVRIAPLPDTAADVVKAAPEASTKLPLLPFAAVPELSTKLPDSPELTALAVRATNAPDEEDVPAPVEMVTEPPDAVVENVEPALNMIPPPTPLLVVPIATETDPARPLVAGPTNS